MRLVERKLYRDLWAIKGRVLSLALIIASGVAILFAIELALQNLLSTQESFLRQQHFADLEITLLPEDTHNLPNLTSIRGVAKVESRLMLPGRIALRDQGTLAALLIFQEGGEPALNRLQMLEGRTVKPGTQEAVVDKSLADYCHYRVGDRISGRVGKSDFDYAVVGIARSPEFLVTTSNPDYVIAQPGSLGILWTDSGKIRETLGFTMVNSLLFQFGEGVDRQALSDQLVAALKRVNVERVTPKAESYSYKQVRMELTAFGVYSPAIILTLCILSLAMGVITFRRFMIEKQREFGVMAALGYRRPAVFAALARVGIVIGASGALLGLVIGWGLGWAFAEVYAAAMHLPFVVHSFDGALALFSLLVGVASGCVSLLAAAAPLLWLTPRQQLIATTADGFNSLPASLKSFEVMIRYGLRSLLRDRVLTVCSVLAMGGSIAVAIAYGLAMTSTFETVSRSFGQELWTHAVDFQYPLYADETDALRRQAGADAAEPYYRTTGSIRAGDRRAIALLVGLPGRGDLRRLLPSSGRGVESDGETVISSDLARELGVSLGDDIDIEKGNQTRKARIVGLTNDIYLRTVNLGLPMLQDIAQAEGKVTGLYLRTDATGAATLMSNTEDVARVTDKDALVETFRQQMAEKMGIVYITILFSVGVSILFVTTLVYLGIAEKRSEYAVLRSLGFTVKRLRRMILVNTAVQIGLSMIISVPLAFLLVRMLNERMGKAWFAVDIHVSAPDFLWPMLATLLVAPIVGMLGAKAMLNLDIPQFLRGRGI